MNSELRTGWHDKGYCVRLPETPHMSAVTDKKYNISWTFMPRVLTLAMTTWHLPHGVRHKWSCPAARLSCAGVPDPDQLTGVERLRPFLGLQIPQADV